MTRILVIHGKGMEMRGKVDVEIFGPMKLEEYDEHIRKYASELGVDVDIFHSNEEAEVISKLREVEGTVNAMLINPSGYMTDHPRLVEAIKGVSYPTFEIHMSNPAARGRVSEVAPACRGVVTGIGIRGYYLGLEAALEVTKN